MRKLFALLAVAAMSMTLMAAPALADRPVSFTDSVTFTGVNPCSGEEEEVTLIFDISIHEHQNNFVGHAARSGSTSSGYEMIAGTDSFVANKNVERGTFVDQWRRADGSKFRVNGSFVFNGNRGEVQVDRFRMTCIGNG